MKKTLAVWLALALCLGMTAFPALAADDHAAVLPESLREIAAEAFYKDVKLTSVVIPKAVQKIGAKAFAGCTGLREVYFGNNASLDIASDAFADCGDIHFYAFPETSGELFALSHGYACDMMEEGSAFLERALRLVSQHGGTSSILQSDEFGTMRLIVQMRNGRLPDISAHRPVKILQAGDGIFFVQFDSVDDTVECYSMLMNLQKTDDNVMFVEPDACMEVIDDIEAAGVVDGDVWSTEDPMGFDVYAPFVAKHSASKTTIAVIDSGVKKLAAYSSILRSDGVNLVSDGQSWTDDNLMHGSMIAGIIKDCVQDAKVEILPVRVIANNRVADLSMIALGIQYALQHGADIINLSLNFDENDYVSYWLKRASDAGVKVVVAAGNNRQDIEKVYPANVGSVVAVSGIDAKNSYWSSSNYGSNISYCAPATYVKSTAYPGITRKGTSFSAPMVAAALALLKLDVYHNEQDLRDNCRDLGDAGRDERYGYGLMQLDKLANIYTDSVAFDSKTPTKLAVGDTHALKWTVVPENATNPGVTVTSSNETALAAETQSDGGILLKALKPGTSTLKLKAKNPKPGTEVVSSPWSIQVVQPVKSITIEAPRTRMAIGKTIKMSVKSLLPTDATQRDVTWGVTPVDGKATISQAGELTATALGKVRVYARAADGYGAVSNSIDIEIVQIPDAESVSLVEQSGKNIAGGSIRMEIGETLSLSAAVLPEDAEQSVVWSCESTPTGAVSFDGKGGVKAVSVGSAVIKATADSGVSTTLNVRVAVLPTQLEIHGQTSVDVGKTTQLTLTFTPDNTTEKGVTWVSTNTKAATVSTSGVVTGVGRGDANIIAISTVNSDIAASHSMKVRQPYQISFNANGGSVSLSSKTAYVGEAVGDLPRPTRDYYQFNGWYTGASDGTQVTASMALTPSSDITLYAHWTLNSLSDWVLASAVPSGATVVEQKTETTESTSASLSGWTANGNYWKATGSGSIDYAPNKPGGVSGQGPDYMGTSPLSAYDKGSTKRDVSNSWAGYVYWHWMYNTGNANGTPYRAILDYRGTGPDNGFAYNLFGWFTSTNGSYSGDRYYCNSRSIYNYIVPERTAFGDCQGATRWFRYDYYRSSYTDYQKIYKYTRNLVRYRLK